MTMQATVTDSRTYRATLVSKAPYPLNWDSIAFEFDSLEAAMVQVTAWQKKYPKGLAKGGGRHIIVDSWAGEETVGSDKWGSQARMVDRQIHLDTKKTTKTK